MKSLTQRLNESQLIKNVVDKLKTQLSHIKDIKISTFGKGETYTIVINKGKYAKSKIEIRISDYMGSILVTNDSGFAMGEIPGDWGHLDPTDTDDIIQFINEQPEIIKTIE